MTRPSQSRWPLEPLIASVGAEHIGMLADKLKAVGINTSPRRLVRDKSIGGLIYDQADLFACRLGWPPPWVWEGFDDPQEPDLDDLEETG